VRVIKNDNDVKGEMNMCAHRFERVRVNHLQPMSQEMGENVCEYVCACM
jgi:hypothetical protein